MAGRDPAVYAVLLAGGVGSRLWPVSRELNPKQLAKFIGKESLVQSTIKRLLPVVGPDFIRIVCGREHSREMARHLAEIDIAADGKIICEPCGRNTAPAILLSALTLLLQAADPILCIFPADHVIKDLINFHARLKSAIALAESGHIVTFGIKPHYPETGYGYIEGGREVAGGACQTLRFVEKPDLATARRYIRSGRFFWNSGMFAFRTSTLLAELGRYQPALLDRMKRLDLHRESVPEDQYNRLPDISIDYAVMEHTRKGVVLPSDFGWSDIGSWKSLYEFLPKNSDNNVIDGDVIAMNTRDCFIMGHERLIAANGLERVVIVETSDAIFVSDIDGSRDVKAVVALLKEKGREEHIRHRTVVHPWGTRTLLERKPGYEVLRLVVRPDAVCIVGDDYSQQLTVAEGNGRAGVRPSVQPIAGGTTIRVAAGENLEIENPGPRPLVIIQTIVK